MYVGIYALCMLMLGIHAKMLRNDHDTYTIPLTPPYLYMYMNFT